MSWLFGGSSSGSASASTGPGDFEDLLNKCTSELLPTPATEEGALDSEFESALQLADVIRSGQIKAFDAVKSFRRKLASPNPNVQLRALITLDTAIKNSGDSFLREVAGVSSAAGISAGPVAGTSRYNLIDQLDDLVRINFNHDVRQLASRLVQTWATAFQSKPSLSISNMVLLYTRLKSSGIDFPPVSNTATSAMIDSLSAPSWSANEESDRCERCRDPFTLTNRRHHCRNCGLLFDHKCSSHNIPLPHFGISQPVRVCDGCHRKIVEGAPPIPRPEPPQKLQPRDATYGNKSKEDEDLQLALRLSLESAPSSERQSGYNPGYGTPTNKGRRKETTDVVDDEEDEDLKRAIEASLKDMELTSAGSSAGPYAQARQPSAPTSNYHQPLPNTDLTDGELTSLLSFAQSVLTPNPSAPPTVHDLQPGYERAEASRTALVKNLRETVGRETALVGTRDKMKEIMRLYEMRLDRQLQRSAVSQYAAPTYQPPQQYIQPGYSSAYPSLYQHQQQPMHSQPQGPYASHSPHPYAAAPPAQTYSQSQSQTYAQPVPPQTAQYAPAQWTQEAPNPQPSAIGSPPVHYEDRPAPVQLAETPQPAMRASAPSAPELEPSAPVFLSTSSPPAATAPLQSPSLKQQPQFASQYDPQNAAPQNASQPGLPQYQHERPTSMHIEEAHQWQTQQEYRRPTSGAMSAYPQQPTPVQPHQTQAQPRTYQQLATLPSAPQQQPFHEQQFPSVPQADIAARMSPTAVSQSPRKETAALIDL